MRPRNGCSDLRLAAGALLRQKQESWLSVEMGVHARCRGLVVPYSYKAMAAQLSGIQQPCIKMQARKWLLSLAWGQQGYGSDPVTVTASCFVFWFSVKALSQLESCHSEGPCALFSEISLIAEGQGGGTDAAGG